MKKTVFLACLLLFLSCKKDEKKALPKGSTLDGKPQRESITLSGEEIGRKKNNALSRATTSKVTVDYAKGFTVGRTTSGLTIIKVASPWPDAESVFTYALIPRDKMEVMTLNKSDYDAIVPVPVERIVVTSTTHIPALEALGATDKLVGFPGTDYVSSDATRKRIADGQVRELGNSESINTEMVLELNPDVVIGFGVDGENKAYSTLQRAKIPVIYNGDWMEESPLGKAEWIKFFAPFFSKEKKADSIFRGIEQSYTEAQELAATAQHQPSVLSGALYKDVWYLPGGGSWAARFIADAHANYLWGDTSETGSLSLSIESVLEKGQRAEFWVSPAQFTSYQEMEEANRHYMQFDAFHNLKIFTFAATKGETGGLLYYELAPQRPDLVLKDLIRIFHPDLLPKYEPFFSNHLNNYQLPLPLKSPKTYRLSFFLMLPALAVSFLVNISLGSVFIPFSETISSLVGGPTEILSWEYIIWNYRIPKACTAILVGSGLALSGLLMQTLFRNPLAGPFVLGISSGASLGAALLIMGSSLFPGFVAFGFVNDISLAIAASTGSLLVLLAVMAVAAKVKDTMALLIIGLMFGSITAAIVSVLSYFTEAEKLQQFIYWSYGSVGNLSWGQLSILLSIILLGTFLGILSIKALNALLLGENYARSLGVDLKKFRYLIIISTGLLAGSVTAFAGPIAFVGLAVPHLTRQIFSTTDHRILMPAVLVHGAIIMLLCDTVAQWPNSASVLPINAITSILGAPVVIWLLLRKKKMVF